MKNKIVDIVCLCLVGAVFGGTALWNLVQPNRPTVSETEKRKLAAMPELTVSSLTDGAISRGSPPLSPTPLWRGTGWWAFPGGWIR